MDNHLFFAATAEAVKSRDDTLEMIADWGSGHPNRADVCARCCLCVRRLGQRFSSQIYPSPPVNRTQERLRVTEHIKGTVNATGRPLAALSPRQARKAWVGNHAYFHQFFFSRDKEAKRDKRLALARSKASNKQRLPHFANLNPPCITMNLQASCMTSKPTKTYFSRK